MWRRGADCDLRSATLCGHVSAERKETNRGVDLGQRPDGNSLLVLPLMEPDKTSLYLAVACAVGTVAVIAALVLSYS
jgi:hypothetical protein